MVCTSGGIDLAASGSSGGPGPSAEGAKAVTSALPPVMKNQAPSELILRYMDGIAKRMNKVAATQIAISTLYFCGFC